MKPTEFDQMLASAVIEMSREPTLPATLDRLVALVVDTVESCEASVVLFEHRSQVTVVASDENLRDLVAEHVDLESAPAWTAHAQQRQIYVPDVSLDFRWPTLGEELSHGLGIHSLYAVPLTRPGKPWGALVAYSKRVDAFDAEEQATVRILAMHATAVVADAVQHQQLEDALSSRTVIGQATGIVMERSRLDATAAFGVLRKLSQDQNVKLRDIAGRVVETGDVGRPASES
jgi:transcriptional regulator with GAF, ATPase, and Fis domain